MKEIPLLFIRADANEKIGVGHVMRCLAIAQKWKLIGGEVCYISKSLHENIEAMLRTEDFDIFKIEPYVNEQKELECIIQKIKQIQNKLIILDGYHFSTNYVSELSKQSKLVMIDDFGHLDYYAVDAIVNRNLIANKALYNGKISSETTLLLGPKYGYYREEFVQLRKEQSSKEITEVKKVMISLGGSDIRNYTGQILMYLKQYIFLDITVVIGPAFVSKSVLIEIIKTLNHPVQIVENVQNMAVLMNSMDIVIISGGTTLFEAVYLGIPSISIKVALNQKSIDVFSQKGVTKSIDGTERLEKDCFLNIWDKLQPISERTSMRRQCFELFPADCNHNLIEAILQLTDEVMKWKRKHI